MEKHTLGLFIIVAILLSADSMAAITLSVSQEIKPGDNWRQSVNLKNEKRNSYLVGDFISDNGWCLWDNGKTVKRIELEPLETRVEVLIIKIPEDMVLDKTVCVITFEGSHRYKTEIYIISGVIIVVVGVLVWLLIRHLRQKKKKEKEETNDAFLEEALQ